VVLYQSPLFAKGLVAEGEGFEPPVALTPLRFSSSYSVRSGMPASGRPVLNFLRAHRDSVRREPGVAALYGVR
jgi:hypothetical protein